MGLIRAAIFFIVGNFMLSLVENQSEKIKEIYLIGPLYGDTLVTYVKENKATIMVILMSLLALIM